MHSTINDLGLTDANGGCSCGAGSHAEPVAVQGEVATEFLVAGMTCSHCVASVTEEVSAVEGVAAVAVDLNVGGESRVTVSSDSPLDVVAVRAAIEEAGYSVVTAD
ncbi:heavy-metal-associated domain-containing protein [Herbiconiux sp. A18JL235]|uniref:Heavy-metal-associated domain-containing protein n=1 Tax=Herbiconiux sp. A18JL235 TaxID=3152363 RepID=A0AB39BN56_9MICO